MADSIYFFYVENILPGIKDQHSNRNICIGQTSNQLPDISTDPVTGRGFMIVRYIQMFHNHYICYFNKKPASPSFSPKDAET